MPSGQRLEPGIYMVKQHSHTKGVDHYGVLDVGNQLRIAQADGKRPMVIHQAPPSLQLDTVEASGPWTIVARSSDLTMSYLAFWQAAQAPNYNALFNNCEHFARAVVLGNRESVQVQQALVIGAVAVALIGLTRSEDK